MTLTEILAHYKAPESDTLKPAFFEYCGQVAGPGKYEGEAPWTPYFDDAWGDGCATDDVHFSTGGVTGEGHSVGLFILDADDKAQFPDLADSYGVAIECSESGFISTTVYATKDEYETNVSRMESESEAEGDLSEMFDEADRELANSMRDLEESE